MLQQAAVLFNAVVGPIREGWRATHQLSIGKACHLAESCVHVTDAAFQIHGTHARRHRVLHGAAKIGFLHQCRLNLGSPTHVAPRAQQHPHSEHRQRHHHPKQRVADQSDRGAIALSPQQEAVEHGSERCVVDDGRSPRGLAWQGDDRAGEHLPLHVHNADHVTARDVGRYKKAQERVDGVLHHQRTRELIAFRHGHVQLEHRYAIGVLECARVKRYFGVARTAKRDLFSVVCVSGCC